MDPPPGATELFPIIATPSVERALSFYRDLLGGAVSFEYPGADGRPVYVGVDVGKSHLGIGLAEDPEAGARAISLWVYTASCDATVERMRAAGVKVKEEPADQPWGERVARVLDPDGNEVLIGQRAKQ